MATKADSLNKTPTSKSVAVKKYDQIASSNRVMFLWVAGASVLVSFAFVLSIFLIKQLSFNEKVLAEKGKTASILKQNTQNVAKLHRSVDELRADKNLTSLRSASTTNNLDVILDALPYEGDSVALGSSLQTTLLSGISIESLTVDPVIDPLSSDVPLNSSVDITELTPIKDAQPITFSFKVSGSESDLKNMFKQLNNSIRPIKVITTELQSAGSGKVEVTIQALTYYQPKKTFNLEQKVIKP